ncbi:MAG: hypothetical protein WCC41_05720 [Rhodomicrobium sp.]
MRAAASGCGNVSPSLQTRLKAKARVNRALRLNRVPATETRILNALDREGLPGKQIFVVGTNALFA